jgi:hypothetical protein
VTAEARRAARRQKLHCAVGLANRQREDRAVFEAIERLRAHFQFFERPQCVDQPAARSNVIAAGCLGLAETPESYRFVSLVFRVPADLQGPRKARVGPGEIRCGERQLSEVALGFAFHFQVLDASREHQGLLEMRPSFGIVPQLRADLAEMDETGSLAELLAELTKCASDSSAHSRALTASPCCKCASASGQRRRSHAGCQASPQRETFRQHRHCTFMVTLPRRQGPAYIQGVAAGDVRKSRERKGRTHVVARLRGITTKNPKIHQCHFHLYRDHGVNSASQRQRNRCPQVVEFYFQAPRPFAGFGPAQLAARGFGKAQ